MTRTLIASVMALIGWTALALKLNMRINFEHVPVTESVIRFLSYFTILTNLLTTVYFTVIALSPKGKTLFHRSGTLTALAAFMAFVGLAYHVLLRHVWDPQGLVMVLDETHHTFVPLVTIIFWWVYEKHNEINFKNLALWIAYPILYLVWALTRGVFSSFYPYYFLDIEALGFPIVLRNALGLFLTLVTFLVVFYWIGRKFSFSKSQ